MSFLKDVRNLSRLQKLAFVVLFYGKFSIVSPGALITPFFPVESEKHGVGNILRGIMFSVQQAVSVVFAPFIGMAIVAFGPKTCFITGIAINAIFSIFLGLLVNAPSNEVFIVGSFGCLAMSSLGSSITAITIITYAAKLFPDNFNLIIGAAELFIGIAEFTTLSIGGVLHGIGGFSLPFISFGVLHIITLLFPFFLLPSDNNTNKPVSIKQENCVDDVEETLKNKQEITGDDETAAPIENKIRPWNLLKIPGAMLMVMVVLVTETSWAFMDSTLERHLAPLKLSSTQTTGMFQITIVLYGIACPLWGFIADKMTRTWTLIAAGLILGGAGFYFLGPLPIFGLGNTAWLNIISLSIITLGVSLANIPATEACLLSTIEAGHPDETATYAMVCSLISTGYCTGSVIGSFAAGFLVEGIGYPLTSGVFGSIMVVYGFIIILYFLVLHKPKKRLTLSDIKSGKSHRRSLRVQALASSEDRNSEVLAEGSNIEMENMDEEKQNVESTLSFVIAGDNANSNSREDV